jgi:hypothetical protein
MNISDILSSTDPTAVFLGQQAQRAKTALDSGIITQAEYDELVGDLTDLKRIDSLAKTVEEKAMLYQVVQFLIGFLKK